MKNLASQFLIAGYSYDQSLSGKSLKVFEKFYRALENKYFVGVNDQNQTVRFRIGYISYSSSIRCVNISKTPDITEGITIHISKINWFKNKTGTGAWIDGIGSII